MGLHGDYFIVLTRYYEYLLSAACKEEIVAVTAPGKLARCFSMTDEIMKFSIQSDARVDHAVEYIHDQVAAHQDDAAEQRHPQYRDHIQRKGCIR